MKLIIAYILIAILSLSVVYLYVKPNDVAYINTTKVFESFDLKIELEEELLAKEKEFENNLNKLKSQIISIEQTLKIKEDTELFASYNNLIKDFQQNEKNYTIEIQNMTTSFNDQVWLKLEKFIKDYSKSQSINILVGNTGDKSVIYSTPKFDVTHKCIDFVNSKYAGINEK